MRPAPSELLTIPGVGPAVCRDLEALGIGRIADLGGRDPETMYRELCRLRGGQVDRCMLYVLRCAVYYAQTPDPAPEKLKWWNWKDGGEAHTPGG
jgi:hypothetical protein